MNVNKPARTLLSCLLLLVCFGTRGRAENLKVEKLGFSDVKNSTEVAYVFSRNSDRLFTIRFSTKNGMRYELEQAAVGITRSDIVTAMRAVVDDFEKNGLLKKEFAVRVDKSEFSTVVDFEADYATALTQVMHEWDSKFMAAPNDERIVSRLIMQAYLRTSLIASLRACLLHKGYDSSLWYNAEHPRLRSPTFQRWKTVAESETPFHPSTSFLCYLYVFPADGNRLPNTMHPRRSFGSATVSLIETGSKFAFSARQISADGTTVVGDISHVYDRQQIQKNGIWTADNGLVVFDRPSSANWSELLCVSGDGRTAMGAYIFLDSDPYLESFFMIIANAVERLHHADEMPEARPAALSFDGRIVAGTGRHPVIHGNPKPFVWSRDSGFYMIPSFSNGTVAVGRATGISSNGATCVGSLIDSMLPSYRAFRWTRKEGTQILETPSRAYDSLATAISADGRTIAGYCGYGVHGANRRPCVWQGTTGPQEIQMPSDIVTATPHAISADGSVVVGQMTLENGDDDAFVWTTQNGLWKVKDILGENKLKGNTFDNAVGVSHDGLTVVGTGTDSELRNITWILKRKREFETE